MKAHTPKAVAAVAALFLASCSSMNMGDMSAKTEATGSAGGANSQNANKALPHCNAPLGTMAILEDTSAPWYGVLTGQYGLGPTTPVLKLIVQQSNCFVVVSRGRVMNSMMRERQLEQSGELRNNSNFGKGQMVSPTTALAPQSSSRITMRAGLAAWWAVFSARSVRPSAAT